MPLLSFVPAVTLAAGLGGLGPGLVALALSTALGCPGGNSPIGPSRVADAWAPLLFFWLQGGLTCGLAEFLLAGRRKAERQRDDRENDRRRVEEELRESAELLRSVTDAARVGLVVVDEGHRYLYANRTHAGNLDVPQADIVGRKVADVLGPIYDDQVRPRLERAFQGERVTAEIDFPAGSPGGGGERTFAMACEPQVDASGARRVVVVVVDVTERRRAEEAIKDEKKRLGLFIEQAPAALAMFDREMGYLAASRRWRSDYALGERDLVGRSHYDVFPGLPGRWMELHRRALSGEEIGQVEDSFTRPDGSVFWHTWEVRPWRDSAGEIGGIIIATEDVTEMKHAEETVKEQAVRLGLFIEHAPASIAIFDREMRFLAVSRRWRDDFKLGDRDLVGLAHRDVFPNFPGPYQEVHRRALLGEELKDDDDRTELADGSVLRHSWEVRPWRDSAGEIGGIIIAVEDITERMRSQEVNARLAAIVDSSDDAIIGKDLEGVITSWNAAAGRLFGYEAGEVIGREVTLIIPPGRLAEEAEILERLRRGSPVEHLETVRRRKEGGLVDVSLTVSPVRDASGRVIGASKIARDITERKRAEESFKESEGRLRRVTDTARVGLVVVDEGRHYLYANRAYAEILGISQDTIVGLKVADVLAPVYEGQIRPRLDRAFGGERVTYDLTIPPRGTAPGETRHFAVAYEPQTDVSGARQVVVVIVDVTGLRRAEESSRVNEGRLGIFIEHAPASIAMFDREMRYLAASRRWRSEYKLGERALVGRSHYEVFPDIPERWKAIHRQALSGEVVEADSDRFDRLDGTVLWLRWQVRPWLRANGEIGGIVVATEDITERERIEHELHLSEERFRLFMDHSQTIAWVKDEQGRIVYLNGTYQDRFGVRLEDWRGKTDFELWPEETAEQFRRNDLAVLAADHAIELVETTVAPDGTRSHWLSSKFTFRDAAGRRYLGGIGLDITERMRSQEVNARLAAIVDSSDDAIIGKDLEGVITSWNAAAARLFGHEAEEAIGRTINLIVPLGRSEEEEEILERMRQGLAIDHFETVRQTKLGSFIDVSLTISPIRDASGRVIGASKIARDITELKRAEEARRESDRLARSILDSIASQIAVVDESGLIIGVNDSWKTFMLANEASGRANEGANYLDVCDAATGKDHEMGRAFAAGIREVLDGRRASFEMEYPCHGPTQDRWFIGRVTPFLEGGPRRVVVSHQEVTALKLAEEQLRLRERMLSQSQAMSHVGSWELELGPAPGAHRGALRWSDEAYRVFGYEPGQVPLSPDLFYAAVHPDDLDAIKAALERSIGEGVPYQVEHRIRRPDGEVRFVQEWGEYLLGHDDRPCSVLGTCQDITDRKRAELALRRYAERLEHLREIDRAILSSRSAREVAEAALVRLARLAPYGAAVVAAYDFDRQEIEVIASDGFLAERHPPGMRIPASLEGGAEIDALPFGQSLAHGGDRGSGWIAPFLETMRDARATSYLSIPLQEGDRPIGSLLLVSDRPDPLSPEQFEVAREVANHLGIAIRQAILVEDLRSARARMEMLSRHLHTAQEDERRRIARELHDEIGQALTALKINLQEAIRGSEDAPARLEESLSIVGTTLQQVRGMALDLRPSILDDLGLVAALRWYVGRHATRTGLDGRFVADPDDCHADREVETACFRVVQEALTNVARHSRATRFRVELLQHSRGLQVVIRDDGVGFDPREALRATSQGTSLGLAGMCERVGLIGGKIEFVSEPGGGTEVQIEFPLVATSPRALVATSPPALVLQHQAGDSP